MQRSAEATPLPVELTSFIGRQHETAELIQLIGSSRLLTLTGAGGSGKTRLALEVVKQIIDQRAWAVAWVELASLDNSEHIAQRIAEACGISEEIRGGDAALLGGLLANRPMVLVLDNCEHLVDACAGLVDVLLRSCPDIRILTTSREALGIKGERAWLVPALPTDEAVQLFVERARESTGRFELTEQTVAAVTEICARLDGIPLAIELASARMKVLTPEQVRDRLDDAFRLLKSPGRTLIPRHRTIQAAIDWSYELLSDAERILFRRLAAFRGGFTLDAVESVGGSAPLHDDEVLDLLARLVDRSLIVVREHDGAARYTLLETVLQYARKRLVESGEEDAVRRHHAEYIAGMLAEAEPHLIRKERPLWVERLSADLDNIREALAWTKQHHEALHVSMAGSLWWFWYSTLHWTEAGRLLREALTLPEAAKPSVERAKLLFASGALAALQAKVGPARSALEEAVTLAEQCGDMRLFAYARNYLGMTYASEGAPEGIELCNAAAEWFEQNNDTYGHRLSLLLLGTTAVARGRLDESKALTAKAVQIAREFGQARELGIALQTHSLAFLLGGEYEQARQYLVESLRACRTDPSYFPVSMALDCLAEVLGHQGKPLDAARLLGASEQLRSVIGAAPFKFNEQRIARTLPVFRQAAGVEAFEQAWAEGKQLALEELLVSVLTTQPPVTTEAVDEPIGNAAEVALRVQALGPLRVAIAGEELPADSWAYAKPKELLVFLLCHRKGASRDAIARALWPTATPAQLKNSFHVTLHHLRKALGHAEWVVVENERYRIAPDISCEFDADLFETAARDAMRTRSSQQLSAARGLYRGDLLQGEVVGEWLEEPVARLRRLYVEVSLALGSSLEQTGSHETAADIYEQIIVRDDLHEEAHRRLLACWTRAGDRSRALRHYERLSAVLRDVLDAEPERETVVLYERILASEPV